jgi:hypothetical protein
MRGLALVLALGSFDCVPQDESPPRAEARGPAMATRAKASVPSDAARPCQGPEVSQLDALGGELDATVVISAVNRAYAERMRSDALDYAKAYNQSPQWCCFDSATNAGEIVACYRKLDANLQAALVDSIKKAYDEIKRIDVLAKDKSEITCRGVADRLYADATWAGRPGSLSPRERKRVLAASRDVFAKTCADQKWSANTRACIATRTPMVQYHVIQLPPCKEVEWHFPAEGVRLGIAECDTAIALERKLATCPHFVDEHGIESMHRDMIQWLELPHDEIVARCESLSADLRYELKTESSVRCRDW